jgi:hypothetical protein
MLRGHLLYMGASLALVAATVAPDAIATGDAMSGRALFIGARVLSGGGPPCGACHAIGGASAPFAAALGPELSRSFDGMSADAVEGMLQDLPFPTMTPLYAGRALTTAERADLAAFLVEANGRPAPGGAAVAAYAAVLAAGALAAMAFGARRRRGSARAELLARARRPAPVRRRSGRAPAEPSCVSEASPPGPPRAQGGSR